MKDKSIKLEHVFLVLAILFGLLIIMLTPPMNSPDENVHFINAYAVSRGDCFPEVKDEQLGRIIPRNIYEFVTSYYSRKMDTSDTKYSYSEMNMLSYSGAESTGGDVFYQSGNIAINPIGYLFSSSGIFLFRMAGKVVGDSSQTPYNLLCSAKIANLFVYILLFFLAIRIIPKFKNSVFLIGLMPISIFLGASVNYDAILIPSCILLFAELVRIWTASDRTVCKSDILIVLFCTFILVGIKMLYVPMLVMLLTIPIAFFKDKKTYLKIIGLVVAAAIIAYIPSVFVQHSTQGVHNGLGEYAQSQKQYLSSHITMIPSILYNTIERYRVYYVTSFCGSLGNLDTNIPYVSIILYLLVLVSSLIVDASNISFGNWKIRLTSAIAIIVTTMGSCYAMYINWTSIPEIAGVGADYISGLQGRYFIPAFLLLGLVICNGWLIKRKGELIQRVMTRIALFAVLTIDIQMVIILYARFWA